MIARQTGSSLEMPQNLVVTVSQKRNIFPANPAVKMTPLVCFVRWPVDEHFPDFFCSITLLHPEGLYEQNFPEALAVIRLITYFIQFCQQFTRETTCLKLIPNKNLYYSSENSDNMIFFCTHGTA